MGAQRKDSVIEIILFLFSSSYALRSCFSSKSSRIRTSSSQLRSKLSFCSALIILSFAINIPEERMRIRIKRVLQNRLEVSLSSKPVGLQMVVSPHNICLFVSFYFPGFNEYHVSGANPDISADFSRDSNKPLFAVFAIYLQTSSTHSCNYGSKHFSLSWSSNSNWSIWNCPSGFAMTAASSPSISTSTSVSSHVIT